MRQLKTAGLKDKVCTVCDIWEQLLILKGKQQSFKQC